MIPKQLQKKEFRFIPLRTKRKDPIKGFSWLQNLYQFDSPELKRYLVHGHNIGIVGGFGDLLLIDADSQEITNALLSNLPPTFRTQSGSHEAGHYHFFYLCQDKEKLCNVGFVNPNTKEGLGGTRVFHQYVAIPPSIHPCGNPYIKINDIPIAKVTAEQFINGVKEFIKKRDLEKNKPKTQIKYNNKNLQQLSISDIISLSSLTPTGNGSYYGSHPSHGSTTGMNFWVNTNSDVWFCFRDGHRSGGGWAELIAVIEGIIDCGDTGTGCLRGDKFIEVIKIAQKRYGLKIPEKQKESLWRCFVSKKKKLQ